MKTEKDFEELLKLFNKNKVKYCIVGAYAFGFYAQPRYTKDIDIFIGSDKENAHRIVKSLVEFGFKSLNLKEEDFIRKGKIIQLGYEPVRIDLITSITGCDFKEAWENKVKGTYGKQKVFFVGREQLIKSKKSTGREQDAVDVSILMRINKSI